MFDLKTNKPPAWSEKLKPRNEGDLNKEEFSDWWDRNSESLIHLDPLICEQWIYRHWTQSRFAFLPLDSLSWRIEAMTPAEIFESIHREFAQCLDPKFDLETLQASPQGKKSPTVMAIDEGTWDYPIITLRVPNGIVGSKGMFPDVRLVLVEGHQRHKYLSALHAFEKAPSGPHKLFVLESSIVSGDA